MTRNSLLLACLLAALVPGLVAGPTAAVRSASGGESHGRGVNAHADGRSPGREQGDEAASSHRRMVELLAELGEKYPHGYWLGQRLERMRPLLERMPATAPPERRAALLGQLAILELSAGNADRSLGLLSRALELAPDLPDSHRPQVVLTGVFYQGLAHLFRGEVENCRDRHTPESCILPIRGGGLHDSPAAARTAMDHFAEVARQVPEEHPLHLAARWLLNVAAMKAGEYPDGVPAPLRIDPGVFSSAVEFPRFRDVAPRLGLDTFDFAGGAVVDDFDGDGLLDVFTSTMDLTGQARFFRNEGDGTFTDRTEAANLTGIVGALNVEHADYDGDGDLDLLMLRGAWMGERGRHPNSLLRNDGGTFTDVTFDAGLGDVHYPTQAAGWADYDGDGDLDLYVGNEAQGELDYPSQLFRNEGDGTFVDVAAEAGVENRRWAKGVAWGDYDGDDDPDLYVSNRLDDNRLYRNDGDGTFTDVAAELGVAGPGASFVSWFWDVDNDGDLDLQVNAYPPERGYPLVWTVAASRTGRSTEVDRTRLYLNDGRGGFTDAAGEWGVSGVTLPMAANFGDLDNDGWLDFYLGTGYPGYEGLVPNVMYRNDGGSGFVDVTFAAGFGHVQKGHGISFADIDNDGDLDVFEEMGGFLPADRFYDVLYENPGFGRHWISVELVGRRSNRFGVGARIRVEITNDGESRSIHRRVGNGASFGGNPYRTHVGLGDAGRIERLEVHWPASGITQSFEDLGVDRFLRITEGEEEIEELDRPTFRFPGEEDR